MYYSYRGFSFSPFLPQAEINHSTVSHRPAAIVFRKPERKPETSPANLEFTYVSTLRRDREGGAFYTWWLLFSLWRRALHTSSTPAMWTLLKQVLVSTDTSLRYRNILCSRFVRGGISSSLLLLHFCGSHLLGKRWAPSEYTPSFLSSKGPTDVMPLSVPVTRQSALHWAFSGCNEQLCKQKWPGNHQQLFQLPSNAALKTPFACSATRDHRSIHRRRNVIRKSC